MTQHPESENYELLEELLAGYVLGNLDEDELTWLNQQLKTNSQLQEQVQQLETTLTLLPYALPEDLPDVNLREKILVQAQHKSEAQSKFNRWGWIISGVAALSTLWFGWQNYNLRQQLAQVNQKLEQQQEFIALLHQPNNRLVSFQAADELAASGSLFIVPKSQKAILALQNLESLSGKEVYRLWAVSQGKKTGCANFTPDEQGKVHLEISNDALNDASLLLITIEPEPNTVQPQGNTILSSSHLAI